MRGCRPTRGGGVEGWQILAALVGLTTLVQQAEAGCCQMGLSDPRGCGDDPSKSCSGMRGGNTVTIDGTPITPCITAGWNSPNSGCMCTPAGISTAEPACDICDLDQCVQAVTGCVYVESATLGSENRCSSQMVFPVASIDNVNAELEAAHHSVFFAGKVMLMMVMAVDWEASWSALPSKSGHIGTELGKFGIATADVLRLLAIVTFVTLNAEALVKFYYDTKDGSMPLPYHPGGYPVKEPPMTIEETVSTVDSDIRATPTEVMTWVMRTVGVPLPADADDPCLHSLMCQTHMRQTKWESKSVADALWKSTDPVGYAAYNPTV